MDAQADLGLSLDAQVIVLICHALAMYFVVSSTITETFDVYNSMSYILVMSKGCRFMQQYGLGFGIEVLRFEGLEIRSASRDVLLICERAE